MPSVVPPVCVVADFLGAVDFSGAFTGSSEPVGSAWTVLRPTATKLRLCRATLGETVFKDDIAWDVILGVVAAIDRRSDGPDMVGSNYRLWWSTLVTPSFTQRWSRG
jgi:hypothetical protein